MTKGPLELLDMTFSRTINKSTLELCQGDITEQEVDAIVNAANARLAGGGGVDGAIHRVGGPSIMVECRKLKGCPVGQAVVTSAGNLKAKYVIHTVGPSWSGEGGNEADLLGSAYSQSLRQASEHLASSVAFPSISTGAYGYPVAAAAEVAIKAVVTFLESSESVELVRFVLFSEADYRAYEKAASGLLG